MEIRRDPSARKPLRTTQVGYNEFGDEVIDSKVVIGEEEVWRGSSIKDKNLSPEELVVILDGPAVVVLRRSWRAQIVRWVLLAIATVLAIWWTISNPGSIIGFLPMFAFFPLAVLASLLHARFDSKYVISDKHLTSVSGLAGWNYLRVRIEYSQLKAVEISKTLIQRIFNCGDIRLSTLMFDQPEVNFRDLVNPQYYATVIRLKQQEAQRREKEGHPQVQDGTVIEEDESAISTEKKRLRLGH